MDKATDALVVQGIGSPEGGEYLWPYRIQDKSGVRVYFLLKLFVSKEMALSPNLAGEPETYSQHDNSPDASEGVIGC